MLSADDLVLFYPTAADVPELKTILMADGSFSTEQTPSSASALPCGGAEGDSGQSGRWGVAVGRFFDDAKDYFALVEDATAASDCTTGPFALAVSVFEHDATSGRTVLVKKTSVATDLVTNNVGFVKAADFDFDGSDEIAIVLGSPGATDGQILVLTAADTSYSTMGLVLGNSAPTGL